MSIRWLAGALVPSHCSYKGCGAGREGQTGPALPPARHGEPRRRNLMQFSQRGVIIYHADCVTLSIYGRWSIQLINNVFLRDLTLIVVAPKNILAHEAVQCGPLLSTNLLVAAAGYTRLSPHTPGLQAVHCSPFLRPHRPGRASGL